MLRLGSILSLFLTSQLSAQNLVNNSDFSSADKAPNGISKIDCSTGWTNGNSGTADFFHIDAKKCSQTWIPNNTAGSQDVNGGSGYAGIIAFYDDESLTTMDGKLMYSNGYNRYSEYISSKLTSPLQAGKSYLVKFRVSLAENSGRAVNGLGAYFSKEVMASESNSFIKAEPQVKSSSIIKSTDKWVEISGSFIAVGGEEYITIGLFNGVDQAERAVPVNVTNNKRAYYYIDGVSVVSGDFKDRDDDGVEDSKDKCPDIKGLAKFDGCMLSPDEIAIIKDASAHIYFKTGSAEIKEESFKDLDKLVEILKKHPEVKARVEGHTDNTGNADNNLTLSQKRAKSVADYLVSHGEPEDHISSEGYGITKPVATNDTPEGRAKNRRVEIAVSAY